MAEFLVLSENGSIYRRNCVRIAKKSLVFDQPIDGKITISKERCYYYSAAEQETAFNRLRRLDRQLRSIRKEQEKILAQEFKKVDVKTTHF